MRSNDHREQPDCPCSADLPALLQGECGPREAARLERHLKTCLTCRSEQEELAALFTRLKSAPGYPPHPDLAPSILATLPDDAFLPGRQRRPFEMAARGGGVLAAAGMLLMLFLVAPGTSEHAPLPSRSVSRDAVIAQAIGWLLSQQQGDGSWEASAGAHRASLSGLCLAALAESDLEQPRIRSGADRAAHALRRMQTRGGRMGPPGRTGIRDHAIATWGLLMLHGQNPWPGLQPCLHRALAHLVDLQQEDGSWPQSVEGATEDAGHGAHWALEALAQAQRDGWEGLGAAIDLARGRYGISESRVLPPMSPPMGIPMALEDGDDGAGVPPRLVAAALLRRQARRGPLAGSWASSRSRLEQTAWNVLFLQRVNRARFLVAKF